MNFHDFQSWREQALSTDPDLLDCGETNLYRALAAWQPRPENTGGNRSIHRCDLARMWLARYGYASTLSRNALVCGGVRHALSLIFRELAAKNGTLLWLPQDVYPTYGELAKAAGLTPRTYATLPSPLLPASSPSAGSEYLLIANPWKPLGRYVNEDEQSHLLRWLEASPSRRLLVDSVYDFAAPFHDSTQRLYATGRTVLLHSVTKGWLWPKTFGIALTGEGDTRFEQVFRDHPPGPDALRLADVLLSKAPALPAQVADELDRRSARWMGVMPDELRSSLIHAGSRTPGCYLFPVDLPAEVIHARYRILGIPASAFGAVDWNGSILTSLSTSFASAENGVAT
ncbi:aminotransferase class I/II-fold pyridoxal phosphate-dependent enzyme [Dyella choica]|uniref:Aminotransferase class I/II-fold pyridoxal phosphate-dependent enzyme n=1 Tax=Dyella choica TaxID=1927959 RepID=A0A432M607_9GAMM|nr:aminotransferase class I/II-fold pyridoxal phosphate-dependent enzyme [Dyella choica]RUL75420.1 aminotransferase class I/II-fold pyridoxal phosphate-dependent enzyme [Dyella choica]